MKLKHILIIEDHKEFRQALKNFLQDNLAGYILSEASSGEGGVLIARKIKPNLIVTDFALTGINGVEVARQIKEFHPKCKIILLTMYDPRQVAQSKGQGAVNAFIGKSELFEQLIPTIKKIVGGKNGL